MIISDTDKLKATAEVLNNKTLIAKMIKECNIGVNQIASFKENIQFAWDNQETEKKNSVLEEIKTLLKNSNLKFDNTALKTLITTEEAKKKPRKEAAAQWLRFEYKGKEYFINRTPSGRVPSVLDDYMTLASKTYAELVVEESEVDLDRVVDKKQLDKWKAEKKVENSI